MSARIDEARRVALALLNDLEGSSFPIDAILMKAKRLARLMRDFDAQLWLDSETRGYPDGYNSSKLGTCQKYAVSGGRVLIEDPNTIPKVSQNSKRLPKRMVLSSNPFVRRQTPLGRLRTSLRRMRPKL